jgi:hypothetical protein
MRNDTFCKGSSKNHKGALNYCANAISPYIRAVVVSELTTLRKDIGNSEVLALLDAVVARLEADL